ncbi:hypothetical protein CABS03_06589 [Colletotrichum abscissum]
MGSIKDTLKATVVAAGAYILVKKILDAPEAEGQPRHKPERATSRDSDGHRPKTRHQTRRYSRSFTESTS